MKRPFHVFSPERPEAVVLSLLPMNNVRFDFIHAGRTKISSSVPFMPIIPDSPVRRLRNRWMECTGLAWQVKKQWQLSQTVYPEWSENE